MTLDDFDAASPRAPWLVTLADLALLLTGTLLLFQALGQDRAAAAAGIARAFAGEDALPVAAAAVTGFAPGSATLPHSPSALAAWAREALADPRVTVTVTGEAGATPADVDPATGSAALLAADRARATLAALAGAGLDPRRLQLATRTGGRTVTATLAFAPPR